MRIKTNYLAKALTLMVAVIFQFQLLDAAPKDQFRFEGSLKSSTEGVADMIINIFENNKKISSIKTNSQGNFFLELEHNKQYTLELIKTGFVIQKIVIDSKISAKLLASGGIDLAIDNEIPVFENVEGLKTDIFEQPVIFLIYNENKSYFEQDRKRSKNLSAFTNQVVSQKNKLANNELKNANNLFNKKKYPEAIESYLKVLSITPSNQQASLKIKEIEKITKDAQTLENKYNKTIKEADALLKQADYYEAKEKYKIAVAIYPEKKYAKSKVSEIDSIISSNLSKNLAQFEKLKKEASKAYQNKELEQSLTLYNDAKKLNGEDKQVIKQIAVVSKAIEAEKLRKEEEQRQLEEKFTTFINKAKDYEKNKDWNNTLSMISQALLIKPDDADCKKIKENAEKNIALEKQRQQNEKNYQDTLALADKTAQDKKYNEAIKLYEYAQKMKPGEKIPAERIKEIKAFLKEIEASKQVSPLTENESATKDSLTKYNTENAEEYEKNLKQLSFTKDKKAYMHAVTQLSMMYQQQKKLDKGIKLLETSLLEAKKGKDNESISEILNYLTVFYYDSGMYKQTIDAYNQMIDIYDQTGNQEMLAHTLSEAGTVLASVYQYDAAIETLGKALELHKKNDDKKMALLTCQYIAEVYANLDDSKNAVKYFKQAIDRAHSMNDEQTLGSLQNSMGVVYSKTGNYDMALAYYNQALEVEKKSNNMKSMSLTLNNIGNVNYNWNDYETAIEYYQKSLKIKREINFEDGVAITLYNIGSAYIELKNLSKALDYLNSSLDVANKTKFGEVIQQSYKALSRVYEMKDDFRNAVVAYKSYTDNAVPGYNNEKQFYETSDFYGKDRQLVTKLKKELYKQKILIENQALINKQKEQQIAIKEMEIGQQKSKTAKTRTLLLFSILVSLLVGSVTIQIFRRYKEKKLYGEVISFQKRQITDSIEYASRIQKAVLPPDEVVKAQFPDSFVYNKPKDIVSGDYFYVTTVDNKVYVAVADCTGHGVPGAFMSMLGLSLIKEVIHFSNEAPSANTVLNNLRDALMKSLHQTGREDEARDGIDIALCVIDKNTNILEYSGANNPCYIVRENKIIDLKADRMPIGIHPILNDFNSQQLELQKNDVIYLFSDGYRDQIGEETLKKFRKEYFNNLLLEIHTLPMDQQAEVLDQRHLQWRGTIEQTDDMLIMGLKI